MLPPYREPISIATSGRSPANRGNQCGLLTRLHLPFDSNIYNRTAVVYAIAAASQPDTQSH